MARRRLLVLLGAITAAIAVAAAGAQTGAAAKPTPPPPKPTKVVIIVVDALSKEIVEKYDMDNVEALMKDGVDTPHGYLGHTGSVTVVTHNVVTSGMLPKNMGWTNEGYRDVDGVLGPVRVASTSPATSPTCRCPRCSSTRATRTCPTTSTTPARSSPSAPRRTPPTGSAARGSPNTSIITFASGPTCATGRHQPALPDADRRQRAGVLLGRLRLTLAGRARQDLRHRPVPGPALPRDRRPLRRRRRARAPGR